MSVLVSGWRHAGTGALGTIEPFCRGQQREGCYRGLWPGLQWVDKDARWRWSPCLKPLRCCVVPFCPCAPCAISHLSCQFQDNYSCEVIQISLWSNTNTEVKRYKYRSEARGSGGFIKGWWKVSKRLQAENLSIGITCTGKLSPEGKLLLSFNLEKCTKRDIMKIFVLWKCDCYPGRSTG